MPLVEQCNLNRTVRDPFAFSEIVLDLRMTLMHCVEMFDAGMFRGISTGPV